MDRRKNRDVLFWAFQCAIQDRQAMADGCAKGSDEHADALADIRAFRRMSRRLLGTDRSELDSVLDSAEYLTITEIWERLRQEDATHET